MTLPAGKNLDTATYNFSRGLAHSQLLRTKDDPIEALYELNQAVNLYCTSISYQILSLSDQIANLSDQLKQAEMWRGSGMGPR